LGVALLPAGELAAQVFTVSGSFQYQDKEWSYSGWTGVDPLKPIRRADVYVLDNLTQAVLGSGYTGADGSFSIECSALGPVNVVVRCDADTDRCKSATGFQRIRVTDESGVEYVAFSPVFLLHLPPLPLDIGTVTAGKLLSGADEGNPFNMLDLGVAAAEYIAGPEVGAAPVSSALRFYWPNAGSSYASGNGAHISADDGYDDAVQLHEFGHVVHNYYSESDNTGQEHYFGDSNQDPRLSFAEGFATFFGGCVLDFLGREGLYVDSDGSAQSGGWDLRLRLETVAPYAGDGFGAADEVAVACTLFDLIDDELSADTTPGADDDLFVSSLLVDGQNAHRAWWDDFVGPVKDAANLTLNHAWDGWFTVNAPDPHYAELKDAFEDRRMRFWPDAQEPDNGLAEAVPTPASPFGLWTLDRTLYWSAAVPAAPGTGDEDWYAVDLVAGSTVTIETRYPGAAADADTQADTWLDVYAPSGALAASTDAGGTGRNAAVVDLPVTETGTWHYSVRTVSSLRRYGKYDVRTLLLFENHLPLVTAGPTATPDAIDDDETAQLDATAIDPDFGQELAYAWTPLSGGSIEGSGASVSFDPPAVAEPTVMTVQLVVSDNLGAAAAPVTVEVTVSPASGSPCQLPATATTGGVGKPGLFGVPDLAAQNLPVVPSGDFAIQASNCHPGLSAMLVFGFSLLSAPFDGGMLYPAPDILLPVATSPAGVVHLPIGLTASPTLCGLTLHCQLLVLDDPGAAGSKQTAQTNYLTIRFGN
ncbi:MAG TPA: pre-peptidase C-terminal domain-containing protein, partial [Planctomycetota bacterium]|nr:pre-peptidase C-terminal domain-containing protein [Planctomycetota bacterium]